MADSEILSPLRRRRQQIQHEMAELGDFRQGSLAHTQVTCGKSSCHCMSLGGRRHPRWILTRSVDGKTRSQSIPASAVETTEAQVAEYHRFRALTRELTEVSSRICEERLKRGEPGNAEKKGLLSKRSKRKSARN